MTSMIDGVRMDRLAKHYGAVAEAAAEWHQQHAGDQSMMRVRCAGGCGRHLAGTSGPCSDCLRLVADTLRDAAGRADK